VPFQIYHTVPQQMLHIPHDDLVIALSSIRLPACVNSRREPALEMLRKAEEKQRNSYRWYTE